VASGSAELDSLQTVIFFILTSFVHFFTIIVMSSIYSNITRYIIIIKFKHRPMFTCCAPKWQRFKIKWCLLLKLENYIRDHLKKFEELVFIFYGATALP